MLNIVLHEPEMPANTGNIGRTCVATGVRLHLIEPLGFLLNDKMVKRAGLDYWDRLDVTRYDDYNDFLAKNPGAKVYMATTKSKQKYTDVKYEDDCFIMFGAPWIVVRGDAVFPFSCFVLRGLPQSCSLPSHGLALSPSLSYAFAALAALCRTVTSRRYSVGVLVEILSKRLGEMAAAEKALLRKRSPLRSCQYTATVPLLWSSGRR